MKIVIASDYAYEEGGASKVALTSAMGLAEQGHEVIFFAAVAPSSNHNGPNKFKIITTGQQDILKDPNRLRATIQGLWNFQAARMLKHLLDTLDKRNTIVHVHGWTKGLSSSIVRTALKNGFKVVLTLHDYFVACPNGGFYNYKKHLICHEDPLGFPCLLKDCDVRSYPQKVWRVIRQVIQKRMALIPEGIKYIITINNFSRNILRPFLDEESNIVVVRNPINIVKTDQVEVHKNNTFLFIGRLSEEKGIFVLAQAAQSIKSAVIFVGDGPCRRKLQEAFPDVKISGWMPFNKVLEYLKQARALVFPTLSYETQGLVNQEAAALGIPNIVSDTCAAKESLIEGKTGLLFERGNVDDLVKKMNILEDPEVARHMGLAAYKRYWQSPMTVSAHVEALERVYEEMLARN